MASCGATSARAASDLNDAFFQEVPAIRPGGIGLFVGFWQKRSSCSLPRLTALSERFQATFARPDLFEFFVYDGPDLGQSCRGGMPRDLSVVLRIICVTATSVPVLTETVLFSQLVGGDGDGQITRALVALGASSGRDRKAKNWPRPVFRCFCPTSPTGWHHQSRYSAARLRHPDNGVAADPECKFGIALDVAIERRAGQNIAHSPETKWHPVRGLAFSKRTTFCRPCWRDSRYGGHATGNLNRRASAPSMPLPLVANSTLCQAEKFRG